MNITILALSINLTAFLFALGAATVGLVQERITDCLFCLALSIINLYLVIHTLTNLQSLLALFTGGLNV
jgi:hypothetical protein